MSAAVSIAASAAAFALSVMAFLGLKEGQGSYALGTWLTINGTPITFGVTVDMLSVMMLLVVTGVGTLIQIYSTGYMDGDKHYSRYFAYMSLFMASMLGLVLADNYLMLYIFWEGVGLGSYLLISFWFHKKSAVDAGIKAFVTTRVGDVGLLIGIFIIFFTTGTLAFDGGAWVSGNETLLTVAALLIFLGAVGKSAQFPLHVWLADAMEGPTPVSALIHAATMVAAGVYLVARTYPLFVAHPFSLEVVAAVGAISALMAASIAAVNNDIKRILAYSTVSQLGLMMLALGVGGYGPGTFHLMTHAFFKALLFLCAGSVIHAVHTQDIWNMGGLFSKMKVTGTAFIIGTLALIGIPPFSGFWSKDEILLAVYQSGHPWLFGMAIVASILTAFYMSRLIILVLFGKPRGNHQAHESPPAMILPLMVLSVLAAGAGFIGSPLGEEAHHASPAWIMVLSTGIGLLGMLAAYVIYGLGNKILPAQVRAAFQPLYMLLVNRYYIDDIYNAVFVQPLLKMGQFWSRFDATVIDGIVMSLSQLVGLFGQYLRPLQTGLVQNYLYVLVSGVVLFILLVVKNI